MTACNKSLASQDTSGVVMLPQATSLSSSAAIHRAKLPFTSQPCSKRDSEFLPWAMLGYSSSKNMLPLTVPVRPCVCSQPDLESNGVASCHSLKLV